MFMRVAVCLHLLIAVKCCCSPPPHGYTPYTWYIESSAALSCTCACPCPAQPSPAGILRPALSNCRHVMSARVHIAMTSLLSTACPPLPSSCPAPAPAPLCGRRCLLGIHFANILMNLCNRFFLFSFCPARILFAFSCCRHYDCSLFVVMFLSFLSFFFLFLLLLSSVCYA